MDSISKIKNGDVLYAIEDTTANDMDCVNSWEINSNVNAYLHSDGTFVVKGKGSIGGYSESNPAPWHDELPKIKKIVIDPRINLATFNRWFGLEADAPIGKVEKIDIPQKTTSLPTASFFGLNITHFNFCTLNKEEVTNIGALFSRPYTDHHIYSIPNSICTSDFISLYIARIQTVLDRGDAYGVYLTITDSKDLSDSVYGAINSAEGNKTAKYNFGVILCSEIDTDGYPKYWSNSMRRVFAEIVPYMGRNMDTLYDPSSQQYLSNGNTAIAAYSRNGLPQVYDYTDNVNLYRYNIETGREIVRTYSATVMFSGKPINPSLDSLPMGLSCSGFVDWLFWRYFNENFHMSSTNHFLANKSFYGSKLPLSTLATWTYTGSGNNDGEEDGGESVTPDDSPSSITDNLQPFDLLCRRNTTNGIGHIAVYLNTDPNGTLRVLECTSAGGLVFGKWNTTQEGAQYRYCRLNKKGISNGLLVYESTSG